MDPPQWVDDQRQGGVLGLRFYRHRPALANTKTNVHLSNVKTRFSAPALLEFSPIRCTACSLFRSLS